MFFRRLSASAREKGWHYRIFLFRDWKRSRTCCWLCWRSSRSSKKNLPQSRSGWKKSKKFYISINYSIINFFISFFSKNSVVCLLFRSIWGWVMLRTVGEMWNWWLLDWYQRERLLRQGRRLDSDCAGVVGLKERFFLVKEIHGDLTLVSAKCKW